MSACKACGAVDSFDFDSSAGAQVCTQCGTVDQSSTSESFVVLGRVLGEGPEEGRNYLHDDGVASTTLFMGRNLGGFQNREAYHAHRQAAIERYTKSVLHHFNAFSLFDRVMTMFRQVRTLRPFRWGSRAQVIVTACIYIASREWGKILCLKDLTGITEIPISGLSRAQSSIKELLSIHTTDTDPAAFLEGYIVHFSRLLASASDPPLTGYPNSGTWSPALLAWLRALPLKEVRNVAEGILAFTDEVNLTTGRKPEPVSCAIIYVAMEAVARTSAPKSEELTHQLAALGYSSAATVIERKREIYKLLKSYAPNLPWLSARAKLLSKTDLVANAAEIVKFRSALEERKRLKEQSNDSLFEKSEFEDDGEDGGESVQKSKDFFDDPLLQPERTVPVGSAAYFYPSRTNEPESTTTSAMYMGRPIAFSRRAKAVVKRTRTLKQVASSLLSTIASGSEQSDRFGKSFVLPEPQMGNSAVPAVPAHNTALPLRLVDEESLKIRQQVLSGLPAIEIIQGRRLEPPAPTRLRNLLWTKTVDEIEDDELFTPEELDAIIKPAHEIALIKQTTHYQRMPDNPPFVEKASSRKRRRTHTMPLKKGHGEAAVAASSPDNSDSDDMSHRKSKVDARTRARLAKFFADDGGDGSEMAEDAMALELAIQAGYEEGEHGFVRNEGSKDSYSESSAESGAYTWFPV